MSDRVDALFAGEPPPPPADARGRLRRVRRLLMVALPLDALGILCWTGVPGAALTLWAWLAVDAEMASIEAGVYAPEDAARFVRLRTLATWALGFCIASLLVQVVLLSTPFYEQELAIVLGVVDRLIAAWGG